MSSVILYTQPGCPQCRTVHLLLDKKGIKYTECQDIEIMKSIGINHTPVLSVDGELYTGKTIFNYINEAK